MAPDYRHDNPYQDLLAKALGNLGVTVSFPYGYRRVLPLRRMLAQDGLRPDALHLHWLAPYLKGRSVATKAIYSAKFIVDVLLVRRAGVQVVWTVHNLVGHEQMHPRIELWCRRRLARLVDAIIVHSDQAKELVADSYNAHRDSITVIPHGHYRDFYGPPIPSDDARERLGLPKKGRVFLFFGMIRPYKGVLKLISTWADSPELHGRHTLVIAGEAQDPKYMEMVRSAADAAHGVRLFSGRVPDDQVATFFSATDVVVLPLERALTSGTLVLAQSFGRTVVTSLSAEGVHEPSGETLAPSTGIFSDLHKALIDATTLNTENTIRPLASWWLIASQHAALLKTASSGV